MPTAEANHVVRTTLILSSILNFRHQTDKLPALAVAVALWCTVTPVSLRAQTSQQLFESTCAGCHGLDGKGGEHAPNIVTNIEVRSLSDTQLAHLVYDGVPASGMPAFRSVFQPGQIKAVVLYVRSLQAKQPPLPSAGDAERGRHLFRRARCGDCHSRNGLGGWVGADLSGYGRVHSADEFRQQIIAHNREKQKGITRVITQGGKEYDGIWRNEDNFSLQLETLVGDFLFFEKRDLRTVEHQSLTRLLADQGISLTPRELDQLLSYLSQAPAIQRRTGTEAIAAPK